MYQLSSAVSLDIPEVFMTKYKGRVPRFTRKDNMRIYLKKSLRYVPALLAGFAEDTSRVTTSLNKKATINVA
jgi:hypothetical protein